MSFMLLFAAASSTMIAIVRHLSSDLHPFELAFFRMFFGFLVLSPIFLRNGLAPLKTKRLALHAARGGCHVVSVLLFFAGLKLTPLAKVTALFFSAPLFGTALAFVVLHEIVRTRRIMALLVGFIGTVVVLRPGIADIDLGSMLILAAAATWGIALIIIKVLSRTEASLTTTLYTTLFVTPLALIAAVPVWQMPSLEQVGWFVIIGGLGSIGHLALAQALKEADVSAVLPFEFTKLIWAAFLGYLLFTEIPDWGTWVGGAMIFTAVTYIAYLEKRSKGETPGDVGGETPSSPG
jgi:drug/metabolite transporter (DMT)-like permease